MQYISIPKNRTNTKYFPIYDNIYKILIQNIKIQNGEKCIYFWQRNQSPHYKSIIFMLIIKFCMANNFQIFLINL